MPRRLRLRPPPILGLALALAARHAHASEGSPGTPTLTPHGDRGVEIGSDLDLRDAEARRQAWLKRGGGLLGFELRGFGYFVMGQPTKVPSRAFGSITSVGTPPPGREPVYISSPWTSGRDVERRLYGGGGGAGGRLHYFFLSPPAGGVGSFSAGHIGVGADFSYSYTEFPATKVDGPTTVVYTNTDPAGYQWTHTDTRTVITSRYEGQGLLFLMVPVPMGYRLGLGSVEGAEWHGVALDVSYTPQLVVTQAGEADPQASFNYLGFEVGLDFLDSNGPLKLATAAHGRVFAFVLPPVEDLPLVISVGGGAVWY